MRMVVNDKDISGILTSVKWSGSLAQNARKINFSYLNAPESDLPNISVSEGDTVTLYDESNGIQFIGIVLSVESAAASSLVSVMASDVIWYMGKNKVYDSYEGKPHEVTKKLAKEFNIPCVALPEVDRQVKIEATGEKSIYQIVSEAYGEGFQIAAEQEKLTVRKIGEKAVAVFTLKANAKDIKRKSGIETMVNQIKIVDDKGSFVSLVKNEADIKAYGLLQEIYKKEKEETGKAKKPPKDPIAEANKLLKGRTESITVSVIPSVWETVSGMDVYVLDPVSGNPKRYTIENDTHSFSGGVHSAEYGLREHT